MLLINKSSNNGQISFQDIINTPTKKKEYFINRYNRENGKKVLYIHTPFCTRKCSYCVCQSVSGGNPDLIKNFYHGVLYEQLYEYNSIFETTIFEQVYFGGGTPTIVTTDELEKLFDKIPNFNKIPIKCVEASPETLTESHLELFIKYNFTFISVGIQSLSRKICKKQNRFYITTGQILSLSKCLAEKKVYFNYDLIAFMDKGDIRDLKQFEEELGFVMENCQPSSITIHQLFQSVFTLERTKELICAIKRALEKNINYTCINSNLLEEDIYFDTLYQAEYRLVCQDKKFMHYMWNKYSSMPVKGYDILSLGYTERFHTISNAGKLFYSPGEDKIKNIEYNNYFYDSFEEIRRKKGLDK